MEGEVVIAVIHQPYFMPWLGYFNKLIYADAFIALDTVFFRKNYYHNRTNIKDMHGQKSWLTLPVGSNYKTLQKDVFVAPEYDLTKLYKTVYYSYARTEYVHEYWPLIKEAIERGHPNLLSINMEVLKTLLEILGLSHLKVLLASGVFDCSDPTARLIGLCQGVGANRLILGEGGSWEYHDLGRMRDAGIMLTKQQFLENHPVYPQARGHFIERLSVIDTIFNIGPEKALKLISEAWRPEPCFLEGSRHSQCKEE
jgi:hypothetical protein